jgi:hypothetical protein
MGIPLFLFEASLTPQLAGLKAASYELRATSYEPNHDVGPNFPVTKLNVIFGSYLNQPNTVSCSQLEARSSMLFFLPCICHSF